MRVTTIPVDVRLQGALEGRAREILTPDALAFLAELHHRFDARRQVLLRQRAQRQAAFDAGELPDFPDTTRPLRESDWEVAPAPPDLQDRRVEITGPVDRKMMINAFNSGAQVFMADFEDALSPTWANVIEGQVNLWDAVRRRLEFTNPDGRVYRLNPRVATLFVRPRGWHLEERHLVVAGEAMSASLVDFGLYLFHNAEALQAADTGPYFYLPKLEGHLEARLWRDVFDFSEDQLGLRRGTIKATVLIETILAAFEMDEILYELRDHCVGLNAGRWDYIFSLIKKFHNRPDFVLPDRVQVTMTVPFMRAYTQLLVKTCHRRGAHALGGMAAYIPNRRDLTLNRTALTKVREDKEREARDGFDGTWVAHPDLVPIAREVFDDWLGSHPNQLHRRRSKLVVRADQLLDVTLPGTAITEAGLRNNVTITLHYLESWLRGAGAVALNSLMEDAATAEISRSQVWQWILRGARLPEGGRVTRDLVRALADDELATQRRRLGEAEYRQRRFEEARRLFDRIALQDDFVEFLTLPAYDSLDSSKVEG